LPTKYQLDDQRLRTWLLCHQTYDVIFKCEETVFNKFGLSTQKHAVLMALKYVKGPVTISEVAHWLERNQNGISTLIDRMVKDGLISKKRDRQDRRAVQLVMTKKGQEVLEKSTVAGWKLVRGTLTNFSDEDLRTMNSYMEKMREKALRYANPRQKIAEIETVETENMRQFLARANDYQEAEE
jgi:DNA-binding MarR family transcriptional regulator